MPGINLGFHLFSFRICHNIFITQNRQKTIDYTGRKLNVTYNGCSISFSPWCSSAVSLIPNAFPWKFERPSKLKEKLWETLEDWVARIMKQSVYFRLYGIDWNRNWKIRIEKRIKRAIKNQFIRTYTSQITEWHVTRLTFKRCLLHNYPWIGGSQENNFWISDIFFPQCLVPCNPAF